MNRTNLCFCSAMLVLLMCVGCSSTGSQRSFTNSSANPASMPSRKRMLVIAQTYEQQGYKQRAISAYRQVLKRYPRTEQGKIARERILALNGDNKLQHSSESPEKTLLAKLATKPKDENLTNQEGKKDAAVEEPFLATIPLPEEGIKTSKLAGKSAKERDLHAKSTLSPPSKDIRDATWPEWAGDVKESTVSNREQKDGEQEQKEFSIEELALPSITPTVKIAEEKEAREEILLPPSSAPLTPIAKNGQKEDAEESLPSLALEESQKEGDLPATANQEPQNTLGWTARAEEEIGQEDDPAIESAQADHAEKQKLINQRLASLAYLIGHEKEVQEKAFESLEVLLDHEDEHVRINSAEALFRHHRGSEKALRVISDAFSSSDESIQFIAVHALAGAYEQSPEETIQIMEAQLEQSSVAIQRQVALLLGGFHNHSNSLIPRLEQLAEKHPDDDVREAALLSIICLKE